MLCFLKDYENAAAVCEQLGKIALAIALYNIALAKERAGVDRVTSKMDHLKSLFYQQNVTLS